MPDILTETRLSIVGAAKLSPTGRASSSARTTVLRWITKGVRAGGKVVRLEAVRVGGQWVTSREALERFRAATAAGRGEKATEPVRTPTARRKASEKAMRELEKAGW